LENALVIRDWAPKDQFSVGSLILSRKSFTPAQAMHWDRLITEILTDGTMYKINRTFLSSREARELIYFGPRDPK
jgi:hypothetical protein